MRRTVDVYLRVAPGLSGGGRGELNDMMERKERKPYWRHTKWQMLASVVPVLLVNIGLTLYAVSLTSERVVGFPLG